MKTLIRSGAARCISFLLCGVVLLNSVEGVADTCPPVFVRSPILSLEQEAFSARALPFYGPGSLDPKGAAGLSEHAKRSLMPSQASPSASRNPGRAVELYDLMGKEKNLDRALDEIK